MVVLLLPNPLAMVMCQSRGLAKLKVAVYQPLALPSPAENLVGASSPWLSNTVGLSPANGVTPCCLIRKLSGTLAPTLICSGSGSGVIVAQPPATSDTAAREASRTFMGILPVVGVWDRMPTKVQWFTAPGHFP